MDSVTHYDSPLGGITLAGNGEALTGLWFDGQKFFCRTLDRDYTEQTLPVCEEAVAWLDCYFTGSAPGFTPKLNPRGTAFQNVIWRILLSIPYGQTMNYGQIAEIAARQTGVHRMSARAVGGAVGRNPISLIIPCHRVLGANGSLTGYAGGTDRKFRLLQMERAEWSGFSHPDTALLKHQNS